MASGSGSLVTRRTSGIVTVFGGPRPGRDDRRRRAHGGRDAVQEAQEFDGERHDEGAVLLGGDLHDCLQQSQLQGGGVGGHCGGGLGEFGGSLVFAVRGDDPGAAFAFGLRLAGHGPLVPVGEQLVELGAADHRAQRGLGNLGYGSKERSARSPEP